MGFRKVFEVKGGFQAEYWNMGLISSIERTSKNYGTKENPDTRQIERARIDMRCFKDKQAYEDGAEMVGQVRISVEYPYDTAVSRGDLYRLMKEQDDFFKGAEDVIEGS